MKSEKLSDYQFLGYHAFRGHEKAACRAGITETEYILISYTTVVCGYDRNTGEIWCNGYYSPTTSRHMGWFASFINEQCGLDLTGKDFANATIN